MASIHPSAVEAMLQPGMTGDQAIWEPSARLKLAASDERRAPQAGGSDESGCRAWRVGSPVETDTYIVPGTGGHGRARADGLLAVARAFTCQIAVFGYDATRNDKFLVMTATRPALDALEVLLPAVALQMEQAARAAVTAYASQVCSAMPRQSRARQRRALVTPYFRSYLRGYGLAVAENIRGLRANAISAGGAELARILAADQARTEMLSRDFPDRQPLRAERNGHAAGMDAGRKAGQAAGCGDQYLATHDLVFAML
jgi:hypothetical protein